MKTSTALATLKGRVAWTEQPALSEATLRDVLREARVPDRNGYPIEEAEEWEAQTSYVVGDLVVPPLVRDEAMHGSSYVCTVAGNSGSSQPDWAEGAFADGTVTWERHDAASWRPTFNLDEAAYISWGLKAAFAASAIDFQADGSRFNRAQLIANCRTMQEHFAARLNGSVRC